MLPSATVTFRWTVENLLYYRRDLNHTCETEVAHARAGENRSRNRPHGPDGARRT